MTQTLTFDQLKAMTVAELRQVAAGLKDEPVKGYTQMNKDHLLPALCGALKIEMHAHHQAMADKARLKTEIRELKKQRDTALEGHDHAALHDIRRKMHHLKHEISKSLV